ncbi:MAG: ATP synthase F1 subunit epsilon [Planctomycetota bacterium]|jgi:F-type H+-transporting ATPase subunit epsilon
MAESTYKLDVITPEKIVYSKDVTSIVAHGTSGYLGVLAHHTPLVTSLEPGPLKITEAGEKEVTFSLDGGFMEVRGNKVVVLADAVEDK